MILRPLIIGLLATCAPFLVAAENVLLFPEGSSRDFEELSPVAMLKMPVGPFQNGSIETTDVEGSVLRSVWKTPGSDIKTIDLLLPLRKQLESAGYATLFECSTRDCGGFDFRFKADVVGEPDMHVDLGDFRYLAASKTTENGDEFVALLVSRSLDRGFVQVTKIGVIAPEDLAADIEQSTKQPVAEAAQVAKDDLAGILKREGAVILDGLEFLKGSSDLSGNPASSLRELAAFLKSNSGDSVILVGHTDATGSLEGNVALSKKRAASVLRRLVDTYGVDQAQLSSEGVGFLSPRATNATEAGRDQNRRVEVVLTTSN